MSHPATLKPTHTAIKNYYATLAALAEHDAHHEGATEIAFSNLLAETAKAVRWTLIPKQGSRVEGNQIVPDGTLRDEFHLRRGFWEAKDTADDLDKEIGKKKQKKYPLSNTIFEDTRTAVLYQNGSEAARYDLAKPQNVADLLNQFYGHVEPEHDNFETAVDDFKNRVPDLAKGLLEKIDEAHKKNPQFQAAFEQFFTLCQTALNPNIRREAVDEMLVQHLLTERLFRKIFHDDEFTKRNVIAAEVEKVIDALTIKSFSRTDFLKSLDKFYKAIEAAAETIDDFADKQHFLNTVYERFFQGYSVKTADTHGIVYTPQPIVDFMCASVEEVLKTEFGLTLGSPGVNILDPCTGTGNFIVNLLRRVPKKDLPRVYKDQLFANEVMLLPYYIAALNIEHAYAEIAGEYEAFEGLCFVDTLDLAEKAQKSFEFFTERNSVRVERQKKAPITVIIGNPPYNVGQLNENDNNKNSLYEAIDTRIKQTYVKASKAASANKLVNEMYVKFFRWAADRLNGADGIVCLVSNNSYIERIAFDGMRMHMLQDFPLVYHLDLHGNVRKNPKLSGTSHNVFGIQVGVGITIAIRSDRSKANGLYYFRVDENARKEEKLALLSAAACKSGIAWTRLQPDSRNAWLVPEQADEFQAFIPLGEKDAKKANDSDMKSIFKVYSLGVVTARDDTVYDYSKDKLQERMKVVIEAYNGEVDRFRRAGSETNVDAFVNYSRIKWSRDLKKDLARGTYSTFDITNVRECIYRPFTRMFLYYDRIMNEETRYFAAIFPRGVDRENRLVCVSGLGHDVFINTISDAIIDYKYSNSANGGSQCFPFYLYDPDGTDRRENITDWALQQFCEHYKSSTASRERQRPERALAAKTKSRKVEEAPAPVADAPGSPISKWDIFHYVYALLHHAGYRTKFADNLKRDLPRIPFAPDFWAFAKAGKELAELHLNYEALEPYELQFVETPGVPFSYAVEKMKLSADKASLRVNDSLALAGIPPAVFEYRLGNRSALDWVIDQYRVTEDKRSGIRSDPNRADDPEYIVRLVGQVARVSVETVRIVKALPEEYAGTVLPL